MSCEAVAAALCRCAGFGSILMGAWARYPIALAHGMGLNAYFTYTVVKGMGVPWQTALGAVFLSGVAFLILTLAGIRQMIVSAIPAELYSAVASGVGLFIAFIGLRNAGVIVSNPATLVGLGDLHKPSTLVALAGLLLIGALICARVNAAILLGVLGTWLLAAATGQTAWHPQPYSLSEIASTAFTLNIPAAMSLRPLALLFVFLLVHLL